MNNRPHSPGSLEAAKLGCTCPVIDNHYGNGIYRKGCAVPDFIHTEGCPVHDAKRTPELPPSPGSPKAIAAGCTCSWIKNRSGKGGGLLQIKGAPWRSMAPWIEGGNPVFYLDPRCPVHWNHPYGEATDVYAALEVVE